MAKQQMLFPFALAADAGPYDEASVLSEDLDIRLTLSRGAEVQPFHLICQHDSTLVFLSGSGGVEFQGSSVRQYSYSPGDVVYVPAGTPHRIRPTGETIYHRFKLPESELEGVAWYCEGCGGELHRDVFALAEELPQEGYLRACREFSEDDGLRRCARCDCAHAPCDVEGYRWQELARERRSKTAG
jgi:mannose-6-phosphate isomerase-like protein (cupin superfamily)